MSGQTVKQRRVIRKDLLRRREMIARSGRQERRVLREGGETLVGTVQAARLSALPFAEDCLDCPADLEAQADGRRAQRLRPWTPHMFV